MSPKFWRHRKVLVTGYEGFLGSHLTRALIQAGAQVVGLDVRTRRKETILGAADYRKMKVVKGSVADLKLVQRLLKAHRFEFVFHLAAEAIVGECLKDPLRGFRANIEGTWNILEAARHSSGLKGVIIASSDKAYGIHRDLPYCETAPLQGDHPYDVSKSCADLLAKTYAKTYGVPVVVTRCGNIFGPGDFNFSRLIPDAVCAALTNREFMIRSNGKFTRDYVYVTDIVEAYLVLAEKMGRKKLAGEAFNFSDERPLSVLQVVRKIYGVTGSRPHYKILSQAKYEIPDQYLASGKARRVLGWKPRWSFEDALEETVGWYRTVFQHDSKRRV